MKRWARARDRALGSLGKGGCDEALAAALTEIGGAGVLSAAAGEGVGSDRSQPAIANASSALTNMTDWGRRNTRVNVTGPAPCCPSPQHPGRNPSWKNGGLSRKDSKREGIGADRCAGIPWRTFDYLISNAPDLPQFFGRNAYWSALSNQLPTCGVRHLTRDYSWRRSTNATVCERNKRVWVEGREIRERSTFSFLQTSGH